MQPTDNLIDTNILRQWVTSVVALNRNANTATNIQTLMCVDIINKCDFANPV